ncbi:XRE family transcriptional regulator [Gordonia malaquae]|uniref:helix-turn-helix domain-containing protein n=1 Tax=Gordonia malaquae TaxID=410332 RepID=UPI0030FE408D
MSRLGGLIETLRIARGWTQAELADRSGVRQVTISRYENGLREPDDAALHSLAEAFQVTTGFLEHGQRRKAALAVDVHMRRRATAKVGVWRQYEARLNEYRLHASRLFQEVSLQADQIVPHFDGEDPEAAARMLRMQWRMPVGPVRALVAWIEAAGCLVITEDFGTPRLDGLSQWIVDHPVMMVNSAAPTDRQRWTLAHELRHLVLHNEYIDGDVKADADTFAAAFLMPSEMIRTSLTKPTLGRLIDLKPEWGVSIASLIQRARSLGTINSTEQTRLFKMLSAKGYRIEEPGSDRIPPEVPRLREHLRVTLESQGHSDSEIAAIVGYTSARDNATFRSTEFRAISMGSCGPAGSSPHTPAHDVQVVLLVPNCAALLPVGSTHFNPLRSTLLLQESAACRSVESPVHHRRSA